MKIILLALALQQTAEQRLAIRDEVLAADRSASDTARATGLARGIGRYSATDLVLLYPGAPMVTSRDAAIRLILAQQAMPHIVSWVPLHAEVSQDGSMAVSYGVTSIMPDRNQPQSWRAGKYLTAWRRDPEGWRMVAHAQIGLAPPTAYTPVSGLVLPPPRIPANAADFARADAEFSAHAGRLGAPDAFAKYIAADGVLFPATGELVRGRSEARRLLSQGPPSAWVWRPVAGGAAGSGDIGWTAGEAVITPQGGSPFYTKYLSLWRRERDGSIRFVADGGNSRPAS